MGGQRPAKGVPGRCTAQGGPARARAQVLALQPGTDQQLIRMSASGCPPSRAGDSPLHGARLCPSPSLSLSLPAAATPPHTFFGPRECAPGSCACKALQSCIHGGSGCGGCGWLEGTFRNEVIFIFVLSQSHAILKEKKNFDLCYVFISCVSTRERPTLHSARLHCACRSNCNPGPSQPASQPAPPESE